MPAEALLLGCPLTTVCAQVHFQGTRSAEALVALWERTDAGGLMRVHFILLRYTVRVPLPPTAVVHQMSLQVSLTSEPDSTSLTREDVL